MNVPKLRFPDFNYEWSNIKLGELLEFNNGINADKNSYGKGRKFINVLDILNNEHIVYKDIKGSVEVDAKTENNNKAEYGDLVFLRSSETREDVGKCSVYLDEKEYCLFGGFVIRGKKIAEYDPYFLKLNLETPLSRHQISSKSGGSTRFNVSQGILNSIEIKMPSIDEQKAISKFIDVFNKKIQLQQQKIDLLQEQKKGYLQKMFPKAGETQPEMRFGGFVGDWEERKLGEHAKYRRGSFPQPYGNKEWYDGEGAMPFVQVVDVNEQLTLVDNTKQKISVLAQPKSVFVPKGKVVVTLQGSIGRVAITQYDSYVDRTLLIFEDYEKKTNEYFWAYTIQQKFEIEKQKAPGGTIKTITKEALSDFEVYLPNYEEQQKIGSFFKKLDDTIAIHKRKLDLYKEQKKGFMQQMFI